MLFYYSSTEEELPQIQKEGIPHSIVLNPVKPDALKSQAVTLIVNPLEVHLKDDTWYSEGRLALPGVPPEAIPNLAPYLPPKHSIAGGGFVIRRTGLEPEILLILRKGKWDIPKGKLDEGESIQDCALREVQEEVGITEVEAIQPLGCTWHCFAKKGTFWVKQTYWYEMRTPEMSFTPQEEESIEEVAWVPWSRAITKVEFPIFSLHMKQVEQQILGK